MTLTYDAERAKRAVQFLVDSSYFVHHVTKLRTTVVKPRALPFKDEAEILNELLLIGRQNPKALENLIELAMFKRANKGSYQQQYMATKRARDRKVIQLEELLVGRKLKLDERVQLLQKQYDMWNRQREQFVAKLGDISWQERNESLKEFWTAREQELMDLITEAQKTLERTATRRKVVKVEAAPPKTDFGAKLKDAVRGRGKLTLHKK